MIPTLQFSHGRQNAEVAKCAVCTSHATHWTATPFVAFCLPANMEQGILPCPAWMWLPAFLELYYWQEYIKTRKKSSTCLNFSIQMLHTWGAMKMNCKQVITTKAGSLTFAVLQEAIQQPHSLDPATCQSMVSWAKQSALTCLTKNVYAGFLIRSNIFGLA